MPEKSRGRSCDQNLERAVATTIAIKSVFTSFSTWAQTPEKAKLKEERFILAQSFRGFGTESSGSIALGPR
jgi:hypothetical protein